MIATSKVQEPSWSDRWLDYWYRDRPGWIDGTAAFHELCRSAIHRDAEILEVGPGVGNPTSAFLSSLWTVHGLDVDPAAARNQSLRSFHLLTGSSYPFSDETFGAVVSDYVVEHVESPSEHLREVFRVLAPGGVYTLRTPNLFHYVAAVAAVTPHWFHSLVSGRLRGHALGAHEIFPTFYRLNTSNAIYEHSLDAGFQIRFLVMIEKEPSYGVASRILFVAGLTYERVVNRFAALANFRANILAVLEKPGP
jgi:SAM-dependent methyltransferase